MKIAFHSNQLGFRGTEVSLYNYALYNEEVLKNESVIITFGSNNVEARKKFEDRFETIVIPWRDYESVLKSKNVSYLYMQKAGWNDGYFLNSIPTLIHCVFRGSELHGHKTAFISDYLARSHNCDPENYSIPYIVNDLPKPTFDLRKNIKISKKSVVLGYHGGKDQFNISYVKDAIKRALFIRDDLEFLFMNVTPWMNHPKIHFLPGTYCMDFKAAFVEACDGMIHARSDGETFGLSIAEFAIKDKPVILQSYALDSAHIEMLDNTGIYYSNEKQVYNILKNFESVVEEKRNEVGSFAKNYLKYTDPEYVMNKFKKIYLQ